MNSFDNITNQFANQQPIGLGQLRFGSMPALLLVFSPRYIPQQYLRPMSYNFTEQMVNDLTARGDIREALAPGYANQKDSLLQAVLPASQGILLDTQALETRWSFILTIDNNSSTRDMRHELAMPAGRWVGCGYCSEEPISPNGSVNERALLMFTHGTTLSMQEFADPYRGSTVTPTVTANNDAINQMMGQMHVGEGNDLYLMTPGDVINNVANATQSNEMIGMFGALAVGNLNTQSAVIPTTMNTPKSQLMDIGYSLNLGLEQDDPLRPANAFDNNRIGDPYDNFCKTFRSNVTSSNGTVPTVGGVDITKPLSLGALKRRYPMAEIKVSRSPGTQTWEVSPQSNVSARNTLSSMISATISACAAACCIDDIIFRFSTYVKDCLTPGMGVWQISHIGTIMPATEQQVISCANQFKMLLERDLFPIIKATAGDFDVTVRHNMANQTIVDLNLMNYSIENGWYETAGKLGGFISPIVGTLGNVQHNASQLHHLMDAVGMKVGGYKSPNSMWTDEVPVPQYDAGNVGAPNQFADFSNMPTWSPHGASHNAYQQQPLI